MLFKQVSINDVSAITNLWNRNIGHDFPISESLMAQNSFHDENIEQTASIAAWDGNKLVGIIFAKRFKEGYGLGFNKEVGWIQLLLVDKFYRQKGIGTKLLERALNHFKQLGIKKVHLGRDVWHYFPGIPAQYNETIHWFEKKGFIRGDYTEVDLVRHFTEDHSKEKETLKNSDAQFSVLNIKDKDKLLAFLKDAFPGRWEYEAIKYFELGGTGSDYVVYWMNDEIKGFCRMNDEYTPFTGANRNWSLLFQGKSGGIGPLGIHQSARKSGLGLDIVKYAINTLYDRGCRHIVIDWTGLISFYEKVGFKVYKEYVPLSIDL